MVGRADVDLGRPERERAREARSDVPCGAVARMLAAPELNLRCRRKLYP